MWLSRQHIEQSTGTPEAEIASDISEMLSSGKSVGSVVTDLVDTYDNVLVRFSDLILWVL